MRTRAGQPLLVDGHRTFEQESHRHPTDESPGIWTFGHRPFDRAPAARLNDRPPDDGVGLIAPPHLRSDRGLGCVSDARPDRQMTLDLIVAGRRHGGHPCEALVVVGLRLRLFGLPDRRYVHYLAGGPGRLLTRARPGDHPTHQNVDGLPHRSGGRRRVIGSRPLCRAHQQLLRGHRDDLAANLRTRRNIGGGDVGPRRSPRTGSGTILVACRASGRRMVSFVENTPPIFCARCEMGRTAFVDESLGTAEPRQVGRGQPIVAGRGLRSSAADVAAVAPAHVGSDLPSGNSRETAQPWPICPAARTASTANAGARGVLPA